MLISAAKVRFLFLASKVSVKSDCRGSRHWKNKDTANDWPYATIWFVTDKFLCIERCPHRLRPRSLRSGSSDAWQFCKESAPTSLELDIHQFSSCYDCNVRHSSDQLVLRLQCKTFISSVRATIAVQDIHQTSSCLDWADEVLTMTNEVVVF